MELYEEKKQCYGCGACAQICPKNAIVMTEDAEGFLYPWIDEKICVNCGKCARVCQIGRGQVQSVQKENVPKTFAVYHQDESVRLNSSSGGVFFAIAKHILSLNGAVYGASFDSDFMVRHSRTEVQSGLEALMKSKYVQSSTGDAFQKVKEDLLRDSWVLFAGTPCQITGLCGFLENINAEKLICVSVICHGTCSPMVWKRYLELKKGQYACEKIVDVNFRGKALGWHDFVMDIKMDKADYQKVHREDLYMKGFLENLYLRPSCYSCKAKPEAMVCGDIVIGDYWGIEKKIPQLDDNKGTSCLLLLSEKGHWIWNCVKKDFEAEESCFEDVYQYNSALLQSVRENPLREKFFADLKENGTLEESIRANLRQVSEMDKYIRNYLTVYQYLYSLLEGESVGKILQKKGWNHIVLYGVTDLLELFYKDKSLEENDIVISCICDRAYRKYEKRFAPVKVVGLEGLKNEMGKASVCVVCNLIRQKEIVADLLEIGIPEEKIVSMEELITGRDR